MSNGEIRNRPASVVRARRYTTSFLLGILVSSFSTYIVLFYIYCGRYPRQSDPARGFIYPLNDHGTQYYVTAASAEGMNLNSQLFLPTLLALIIVMPKGTVVRKNLAPARGFQMTAFEPTRNEKIVLLLVMATYWSVVLLFGSRIVAFALKSGLSPG